MKNNSTKDNRVIDFKDASGKLKAKHRAQALAAMNRLLTPHEIEMMEAHVREAAKYFRKQCLKAWTAKLTLRP
jgi:hypothetical protein